MATIKVIYNSIIRRFNITSSTTWTELESKLRSLYNIPTTSFLTVSYTDEDDDAITISSDLEFKQVLAQRSSGRPIKLILNTANNSEDEKNDDFVENHSSTDLVKDSLSQRQNRTEEQHTTEVPFNEEEQPEYDQSTPLLNKEKGKETENQLPEKAKDTQTQPGKDNKEENEEDDDDDVLFIISHPWAHSAFFGPRFGFFGGPRFGFFGGPRFGFFGGPRFGLFSSPRYCQFNPFDFHDRSFFNEYDDPFACYSGSHQHGLNEFGQKYGNSKYFYRSKPQQSASCNKNAQSNEKNDCKRNSRPSCSKSFHPHYHNQIPLTQEQLNNKLSNLHSMGFDPSNDALYEDLLKRYNGNLERVIELLLRNQHFDDEKASMSESKKQNAMSQSERNGEIKQVDNIENKPYAL